VSPLDAILACFDDCDRTSQTRQRQASDAWKVSTATYDEHHKMVDRTDEREEGSSDPNKQGHHQTYAFDAGARLTQQVDYSTKLDYAATTGRRTKH
jgi:hypothetical protein